MQERAPKQCYSPLQQLLRQVPKDRPPPPLTLQLQHLGMPIYNVESFKFLESSIGIPRRHSIFLYLNDLTAKQTCLSLLNLSGTLLIFSGLAFQLLVVLVESIVSSQYVFLILILIRLNIMINFINLWTFYLFLIFT